MVSTKISKFQCSISLCLPTYGEAYCFRDIRPSVRQVSCTHNSYILNKGGMLIYYQLKSRTWLRQFD